eukprot:TRINITY_DN56164_c0_g1_i1.p2 TRINITY_DN56164_c0_g1~~TRINITY_DN56164_c0_g1_i1.p2  ORF type:complete len:593 (+),score=171.60 TRINITY_DN56164_c0_g1_i1:177-1955(+)
MRHGFLKIVRRWSLPPLTFLLLPCLSGATWSDEEEAAALRSLLEVRGGIAQGGSSGTSSRSLQAFTDAEAAGCEGVVELTKPEDTVVAVGRPATIISYPVAEGGLAPATGEAPAAGEAPALCVWHIDPQFQQPDGSADSEQHSSMDASRKHITMTFYVDYAYFYGYDTLSLYAETQQLLARFSAERPMHSEMVTSGTRSIYLVLRSSSPLTQVKLRYSAEQFETVDRSIMMLFSFVMMMTGCSLVAMCGCLLALLRAKRRHETEMSQSVIMTRTEVLKQAEALEARVAGELENLPVETWAATQHAQGGRQGGDGDGDDDDALMTDCCLCLESYEPEDVLRMLPCKHYYHKECIDRWFAARRYKHRRCPLCNNNVVDAIAANNKEAGAGGDGGGTGEGEADAAFADAQAAEEGRRPAPAGAAVGTVLATAPRADDSLDEGLDDSDDAVRRPPASRPVFLAGGPTGGTLSEGVLPPSTPAQPAPLPQSLDVSADTEGVDSDAAAAASQPWPAQQDDAANVLDPSAIGVACDDNSAEARRDAAGDHRDVVVVANPLERSSTGGAAGAAAAQAEAPAAQQQQHDGLQPATIGVSVL